MKHNKLEEWNITIRVAVKYGNYTLSIEKLIQDHHQAEYNIKSNFLAELTVHWNFENLILPGYIGSNSFRCFVQEMTKF